MDQTDSLPEINKEQEQLIRKFRIKFWILDIIIILLSYLVAYFIRNSFGTGLVYTPNYIYLLLLMIPTFFILIRRSNFTHIHEKMSFGFIFFNFFQLCIFGLLIIFFFLFIFKMKDISRVFVIIFFVIYMIALSFLQIYRSKSYRSIWKDTPDVS
ncbi:MAG: hypothetical protein HC830_00660 [Bacteroidetes bacterium]|nr:hypothetical protein [Bacteroidota bacterium]